MLGPYTPHIRFLYRTRLLGRSTGRVSVCVFSAQNLPTRFLYTMVAKVGSGCVLDLWESFHFACTEFSHGIGIFCPLFACH